MTAKQRGRKIVACGKCFFLPSLADVKPGRLTRHELPSKGPLDLTVSTRERDFQGQECLPDLSDLTDVIFHGI